jgi:hypothetical protein
LAFADDSTLVYGSGNTLSFIGRDGTHIRSIPSHGEGVGCLGVCANAGLLAYSELTINPRIFVLSYPQLEVVATLKGGAQLGYSHLEFSRSGNYLLSVSDVPDLKLTLWKTTEGVRVCDTHVGPDVQAASFNPLNWKQICTISSSSMKLWILEQSGDNNLFTNIQVQLPFQTAPVGEVVEVTASAVQPLSQDKKGLDLEKILYSDTYIDISKRPKPVIPKSHCWTPNGSIYCGCQGGELFLVDADSGAATVLLSPLSTSDATRTLLSEAEELFGGDQSVMRSGGVGVDATVMDILEEESSQVDMIPTKRPARLVLHAGDLDCMALNRKGLYVAGKNGTIYCLELSKDLTVTDHWDIGDGITRLHWSASYDKLALTTEQCVIHLVEPFNLCNLKLVVDYASEQFVGVDVLTVNSNFSVTCRRSGTVQVWSTHDAALLSTLNLQTQCCCIRSLSNCSGAVVGSESGHLYFLSLLQPRRPHLVSRLFLYHSPLSLIAHDKAGHFVVAASKNSTDVYILDARPSSGFQVIGRLEMGLLVSNLSVASEESGAVLLLVSSVSKEEAKTVFALYRLPVELMEREVKDMDVYVNETRLLRDSFVRKWSFSILQVVDHLSVLTTSTAVGILPVTREIVTVNLPQEDLEGSSIELEKPVKVHDMKVKSLALSLHGCFVLLGGADGRIQLRLLSNLHEVTETVIHDIRQGGCIDAAFTNDSCHIISAGDSGLLLCARIE